MNALRSVFAALANLAASVNSLAVVIDAATGRLRQQLAEGDAPAPLPHNAEVEGAEGNPSTNRRRKAMA